jgi:hypothetical protein
MKKLTSNITLGNRRYKYSLEQKRGGVVFVECMDANVAQNFLAEDVPALLIDLPNLILAEKKYKKNQSEILRFRISTKRKRLKKVMIQSLIICATLLLVK